MSERSPYNPMFDLQQNLLAQGQRAFRQGMDMQGQAMEAFVRGLEAGRELAAGMEGGLDDEAKKNLFGRKP